MSEGGPPPQAQIDQTLRWVGNAFRRYYEQHPCEVPRRLGRREFGFMWIGKRFMRRHVGFRSRQDLHRFMLDPFEGTPAHCYYSTAYYTKPDGPTMQEKGWLGADLIFDLDADHLPNAETMTFEEQLVEVKKQALKLLEDFLIRDFGFDPALMQVVFSGGRGYHIHVFDPKVLRLEAAERREIVDYVAPNQDVVERIVEGVIHRVGFKEGRFGIEKTVRIPRAHEPGWAGRFTRTLADYLEGVSGRPRREGVKELTRWDGIGEKTAADLYDGITPDRIARIRNEGYLDQFQTLVHKKVVEHLLPQSTVTLAPGETDEPVTADVKRLIRLPTSLHGKTGLRVTPIPIDRFREFDPLRHAVVFGTQPAKVVVSKPEEIRFGDDRHKVEPGEQELPFNVALFLALRRKALLPMR